MAKKQKCPPAGAPEWMLTYGDMMTLLLCFFVLIVSFSEIKKEDQFQAVVEQIKTAFGMKGGGGVLPTLQDPTQSLVERLDATRLKQQKRPNHSNTDDPGIEGREQTVTQVREGVLFAVGGPVVFEPGSAELTFTAKQHLKSVVFGSSDLPEIKGHNNVILLRGHAASMELHGNLGDYRTLADLSYARASAVADFLVSDEVGIRADRLRLIACADYEPVKHRVYGSDENRPNRRVELLVGEALVKDLASP